MILAIACSPWVCPHKTAVRTRNPSPYYYYQTSIVEPEGGTRRPLATNDLPDKVKTIVVPEDIHQSQSTRLWPWTNTRFSHSRFQGMAQGSAPPSGRTYAKISHLRRGTSTRLVTPKGKSKHQGQSPRNGDIYPVQSPPKKDIPRSITHTTQAPTGPIKPPTTVSSSSSALPLVTLQIAPRTLLLNLVHFFHLIPSCPLSLRLCILSRFACPFSILLRLGPSSFLCLCLGYYVL